MLKQLKDANGVPLYDSNGKPLMYESTAEETAEESAMQPAKEKDQ